MGDKYMSTQIHTIKLGFDQCYLIGNKDWIMIDAGESNKKKIFLKKLAGLGIKPVQIKLVIITHGHWDHIGSARDIKELTGAKIAMHENEKDWLEKSIIIHPPGVTLWGKIFSKIIPIIKPRIKIPSAKVDIVLGNTSVPLNEYGIAGFIEYTPGHSSGSVSVILESGEAFVGDLLMNRLPLRMSPGVPIFAEDLSKVKQSLELLLEKGVRKIYPAHGKPFNAEIINKELEKLGKHTY
jgi:glyoxylase-like metal-dependent hydrolase (beta-lactamase superfamily II)